MADKAKDNLLVLTDILVDGKHTPAGAIIPKTTMAKTDWQNLAFAFDPARVQETNEDVRSGAPVVKLPGVK